MAAYAASVSSKLRGGVDIDPSGPLVMFAGRVDITNYNPTTAEITAITGKFKTLVAVMCDSVSDEGYVFRWDHTAKAFKAYFGDYSEASDGPLAEAPVDTDVGAADFIAVGIA